MYRHREIAKHGKPDINGVLGARKEKILSTIEQFFDCMLTGYIIRHVYLDNEMLEKQPLFTYVVLIDIILMFLSLGFNYII